MNKITSPKLNIKIRATFSNILTADLNSSFYPKNLLVCHRSYNQYHYYHTCVKTTYSNVTIIINIYYESVIKHMQDSNSWKIKQNWAVEYIHRPEWERQWIHSCDWTTSRVPSARPATQNSEHYSRPSAQHTDMRCHSTYKMQSLQHHL